jgi:hypothetical protein
MSVGAIGLSLWIYAQLPVPPNDYDVYMRAARGELIFFYYPYWALWLFGPLAALPFAWGFSLWGLINVGGVWFATRVFGGRTAPALLAFQMLYVVFLGSVAGLIVGALGLLWWGALRHRWPIVGLALIIASLKIQMGGVLGLILLLAAPLRWRERWLALLIPSAVAALSLLAWPGWPSDLWRYAQATPPNDWGSLSLWRWLGPWALLLWLPPLLLPMSQGRRLLALAAANALAAPYYQQTDLLALFALPLGWLPPLLGQLGWLVFFFPPTVLRILAVVPATVYVAALAPVIAHRLGVQRASPSP